MLISTRQLRAFLSVVKFGNFTKAADRMHITQAGLSGMIRELETQLQCRLFNRTTRSVELTEAGGHLLPYVRRALEEMDAGVESLSYVKELRRGRLRVGITPFLAAHIVPSVIKLFDHGSPEIQLELVDAEQIIIQQLVDNGELDAAYGYLFTQTAGVRRQSLYVDRLTLIASPDAFAKCKSIKRGEDWEHVREATLICLHRSNPLQHLINEFLVQTEAPAFRRREVRHLATVIGLVSAGLGIALVPSTSLVGDEAGHIRQIPLGPASPLIEHCCLTKAGAERVEGLEQFSQLLAEAYRSATRHLIGPVD